MNGWFQSIFSNYCRNNAPVTGLDNRTLLPKWPERQIERNKDESLIKRSNCEVSGNGREELYEYRNSLLEDSSFSNRASSH